MRKRLKLCSENRTNNIDNASLHFVQKRKYHRRSASPNVTTVFHTWANKRFIKMKNAFRSKVMTGAIERTNLHRGRFSNRFDIVSPSKIRRKRQSKKTERGRVRKRFTGHEDGNINWISIAINRVVFF